MAIRLKRGMSGLCDSLIWATNPIGLLFCPSTSLPNASVKVGKEIQEGAPLGTIIYDTVTGAGDNESPEPGPGPSAQVPLWVWGLGAAGLLMFAFGAVGGGSPRRYGR